MPTRRTFLLAVVVSLCVAALLGIWTFLFGRFGLLEARILGTTLSVALFSLIALGAALLLERNRWRPAMFAALACSATGLVLYMLVIWLRLDRWVDDDLLVKSMVWLATWAVALPHAGLLGLTRFSGGLRVARRLALAAVFALAAAISVATLMEFEPDDFWLRAVGVLGILAALGTIGMPVLHRIHGLDRDAAVESTPLRLALTCPRCQLPQTLDAGHSRCARCRLRFHIEIEEPRCPRCNYLLHKLTQPRCPECGARLDAADVPADHGNS